MLPPISQASNSRVSMPEELKGSRKRPLAQPNQAYGASHSKLPRQNEATKQHLKPKVKNLQQQLRRHKVKLANVTDVINKMEEDLIVKSELADRLHKSFDKLQLEMFYNAKNNTSVSPTGRRYTCRRNQDIRGNPFLLLPQSL